MRIFWYFEVTLRGLDVLARAIWRRTPSPYKKLKWLKNYIVWSFIMIIPIIIFPRRGTLFMALYAWFRALDDVLDGEDPCPPKDIGGYTEQKSTILEECLSGSREMCDVRGQDRLIVMTKHLVQDLGIDSVACRHMLMMLEKMVTDYKWRTEKTLPSGAELEKYASEQDVAIFQLMALVFGIKEKDFVHWSFEATGVFTKSDWICDFHEDMATGLIHISSEECAAMHIGYEDLVNGRVSRTTLKPLIRKKILEVLPLWKQVFEQKEIFFKHFKQPLLAFLYDHYVMRKFESMIRKECQKHGIAFIR